MLYLENGEWKLSPFKVVYQQHGEIMEQYTHNKQWWIDFAEKWEHTEIVEFVDVEYTDEQMNRLQEVQKIDEGFEYYAARYVMEGLFPNELEGEERLENHPLKTLQLQKENELQGQAVTDVELRLMALEMGGK